MTDGPRRAALREAAAAAIALALAALLAGHLALSDRSWLIYADGDSMLPALLQASLRVGQRQDWALSAPLFIPEVAAYRAVAAVHLPVASTLTIAGIVNWSALYAALRFVAGASRRAAAPFWALGGFTTIVSLALLERSSDRNSLESVSLLSTGTYYSATIVGMVLIIGIVVRLVPAVAVRRGIALLAALFALTAFLTLTNPLVVPWCVAPLAFVGLGLAARRLLPWSATGIGLAVLAIAVAAGLAARLPFASMLVESTDAIYRPALIGESAGYYAGLVAALVGSWQGALEALLVLALVANAAVGSVVALRRGRTPVALVATIAWLAPVLTVGGAIVAGTVAARYLQPVFFLPVVALVVAGVPLPGPARGWRPVVAAASIIPLITAIALLPPGARRPGALTETLGSIQCVADWVTSSRRIGAGTFWTIRAPKAYLPDPRQLVQTDASLNPYVWLVDRADYDGLRSVSFLVSSADAAPPEPPRGEAALPTPDVIRCGRYTITDYRDAVLRLGAPRS
ncbi:hypothetical protein QT381_14130 [Galbitalea sp. SE-J8]|uniref:hypothetical protein n=1 Tax=Galbitalea sp. SE-J8 TaxID=3054952 RepID=UPI00259D27FD|nr:hypothetical protein [Galbitalea sp. SE-J8]MDM4764144.1 hypothetical protein [Galbitalea sp. SE-J8]